MPEAALYYGLLMAKVSPDTAMIPFAVAMLWALAGLTGAAIRAGGLPPACSRPRAAVEFTAIMLARAVLASRWCRTGGALAVQPLSVGECVDRGRCFRGADLECAARLGVFGFRFVRAVATHEVSLRTVDEFIGLQFGLVGFVMLPVVLSGVMLTAWRGYRAASHRDPAVDVCAGPLLYFGWKSLTLRVGDTWPMFLWPAGFAAAAINLAVLLH